MVFDIPWAQLAQIGVDKRILALISVAVLLVLIAAGAMLGQRMRVKRSRLRSQGSSGQDAAFGTEGSPEKIFAAPGTPLLSCHAELMERRPLSEAQWDSPVPAAWTIFKVQVQEKSELLMGLLLPVQHKEAYSSGFIERLEGAEAGPLLEGFAKALGAPVPGPAITGSSTGFLEFKSYVHNDKPEVIPGNLDLSAADYWIFVKLFVQNTLEFYVRVNASQQIAEIAAARPAQGEELMRVLAATLRPEASS